MKRLIHPDSTPPKGWRANERGHLITAASLVVLGNRIADYRIANGYPVGSQFDDEVQDMVCNELDKDGQGGLCVEVRMDLVAGIKGVFRAGLGIGLADTETFQRRNDICMACPHAGINRGVFSYCKICKCRSDKLRLATERCPINKW